MNTALAVTLAGHLIAAAVHAAAPLFPGAALQKAYQQAIRMSIRYSAEPVRPASPVGDESDHASSSYRLPVHHPGGWGAPYRGTAPLPGSEWTLPEGAFGRQRSAMQSFAGQGMQNARNTNFGHAYTYRRY